MKWLYVLGVLGLVGCSDPAPSVPLQPPLIAEVYREFLTNCSGVTITETVSQAIAYSTCVGYARGIADGHQITVDGMARILSNKDTDRVRLWCVPPSTTNEIMMGVVVSWIDNNPQEYIALMDKFDGITAATAVIVKALGTAPEFKADKC
jgi:Rap1a immunity proteins